MDFHIVEKMHALIMNSSLDYNDNWLTSLDWDLVIEAAIILFKFLNIIHNFFYNKNWSPRSKFTSKPCMLYWAPRDHFTETQSMFGYMSITSLESQSGNRILWNNLTILNIIKCVQPYKSRLLSDIQSLIIVDSQRHTRVVRFYIILRSIMF